MGPLLNLLKELLHPTGDLLDVEPFDVRGVYLDNCFRRQKGLVGVTQELPSVVRAKVR